MSLIMKIKQWKQRIGNKFWVAVEIPYGNWWQNFNSLKKWGIFQKVEKGRKDTAERVGSTRQSDGYSGTGGGCPGWLEIKPQR